ncbi:MAG: lactate/malate family dehydrogenase [Armatimonadota bacterium]
MEKAKFAFIIHPLDARRDVARKYPIARYLPVRAVEFMLKLKSPMILSHIRGVRSLTGAEAEGWFVGCPLTPKQMLSLPLEFVWKRITEAGMLAAEAGAKILGLGAFTSVVGDGGVTVASRLPIAVTTGNSYTVATAVEGALKAAEMVGLDPAECTGAVVGAAGSIGRTCAILLARSVPKLVLVGRNRERLEGVQAELAGTKANVLVASRVEEGLRNADMVITVTSAVDAVIQPAWLKTGSVVCDVARPRDVSRRVVKERDDVLVIEGGVVEVPGEPDFGFDFGFPPRTAYACMSETMMLALEGRYENFTLGKDVSVRQVEETQGMAVKHGFKLAGFRSFERPVTEEQIDRVRRRAGRRPL